MLLWRSGIFLSYFLVSNSIALPSLGGGTEDVLKLSLHTFLQDCGSKFSETQVIIKHRCEYHYSQITLLKILKEVRSSRRCHFSSQITLTTIAEQQVHSITFTTICVCRDRIAKPADNLSRSHFSHMQIHHVAYKKSHIESPQSLSIASYESGAGNCIIIKYTCTHIFRISRRAAEQIVH